MNSIEQQDLEDIKTGGSCAIGCGTIIALLSLFFLVITCASVINSPTIISTGNVVQDYYATKDYRNVVAFFCAILIFIGIIGLAFISLGINMRNTGKDKENSNENTPNT